MHGQHATSSIGSRLDLTTHPFLDVHLTEVVVQNLRGEVIVTMMMTMMVMASQNALVFLWGLYAFCFVVCSIAHSKTESRV